MGPSIDKLATIVREISTKSALNPMLWLFGFCSLVLMVLNIAKAPLVVIYTVTALLLLSGLTVVGGFVYFMFNDPNRLQDERHVERMFAMQQQANHGQPLAIGAGNPTQNPKVIEGQSVELARQPSGQPSSTDEDDATAVPRSSDISEGRV